MTLRGIGAVEPGTLVLDIGGGSTEVQVVGTDVRASLDVGCVRLTERFGEDVDAIRAHVRGLLPEVRPRPRSRRRRDGDDDRRARPRARASTTRNGSTATRSRGRRSAEQTARLAAMTVEERARIVEPGRAPVIVAGAAILSEMLDAYGLDAIEASERDILHGAALAASRAAPEPEEGAAPPGAYTCC